MKSRALVCAVALVSLLGCAEGSSADDNSSGRDGWVTVDRLNRRTCPKESCGSVGVLFFRENASIYEEQNGWARISKYYDASCQNGKSEYVDSGNASCNPANGIVDGRFAEWVSSQFLSSNKPNDPAAGQQVTMPWSVAQTITRSIRTLSPRPLPN